MRELHGHELQEAVTLQPTVALVLPLLVGHGANELLCNQVRQLVHLEELVVILLQDLTLYLFKFI